MRFDRKALTLAEKEAFTLNEAAAVYGEDLATLRGLVAVKAIPAVWRGKSWSILRSHLNDYYRAKAERETRERGAKPRRAAEAKKQAA